jgi:predicted DNA-binding transcriptional regulator AlpA
VSDQIVAPGVTGRKASFLEGLPVELIRERILPTKQTCEFVGVSVAHWRRLRDAKLAPPPIMIGSRRQGWRLGTLIDWSASREQPAA